MSFSNSLDILTILKALILFVPKIPFTLISLLKLWIVVKRKSYSWGEFIWRQANKYPHNIALLSESGTCTYAELEEKSNQMAHLFRENNIQQTDIVAVILPNSMEYYYIFNGLAKVGATALLVNPGFSQSTIKKLFSNVDVKGVIRLDPVSNQIVFQQKLHTISIMKEYEKHSGKPFAVPSISIHNPVALLYTSGTTGHNYKLTPIKHLRLLMGAIWFGEILVRTKQNDVFMSPLPYYHATNLAVAWPSTFAGGAGIVVQNKFSVSAFHNDVNRWGVTCFVYVGELLTFLMNKKPDSHDRLHNITKIVGNGLRPELWRGFKKRFGINRVYEFYGASESSKVFSNILNLDCTPGMSFSKFVVVKINADTNKPLRLDGLCVKAKASESGLLLFKLPKESSYYFYVNRDEAEKKVFRSVCTQGDYWFSTGDLVISLGFRHIRFLDRIGGTYRWKGENCSTTRVESLLYKDERINTVICFGVALKGYDGKAGMVVISVMRGTTVDTLLQDIARMCFEHLLREAIPRFIRIVDGIEKTDSFKSRKFTFEKEGIEGTPLDGYFILDKELRTYVSLSDQKRAMLQSGVLPL